MQADPAEDAALETFELQTSDEGSARVLRAFGEIDITSAPTLRSALLPALNSSERVVLDLSEVSFLGSSGLAVLVEGRDQAQQSERDFRLVCTSRIVIRALEATGLRELFDISPDLASALNH
jgi:anti-sigma B factor antagonist